MANNSLVASSTLGWASAQSNALKVVRQNLGAIEKTVEMIVEQLDGTDVYIAP